MAMLLPYTQLLLLHAWASAPLPTHPHTHAASTRFLVHFMHVHARRAGAAYLSQISIYTSESRKTCLPYQHEVTGPVVRADDHTLAVPVRSLRGEDCIAVVDMQNRLELACLPVRTVRPRPCLTLRVPAVAPCLLCRSQLCGQQLQHPLCNMFVGMY